MTDYLSLLSSRIKFLRKERHLTQEALAELADISTKTLKAIETKRGNPTLDTLCAIADALNWSLFA